MTDRQLAEVFFGRCYDLPKEQRDRLLGMLSDSIREEVESLLRAVERADDWLPTQSPLLGYPPLVGGSPLGEEFPRPFGGYTILSQIGHGGMGWVYLADHKRLERHVAIKMLPTEYRNDPIRTEMLLNEARSAAKVSHAAIGTIYEADMVDDIPYIAMEYVEGQTLKDYMDGLGGPLTTSKLLNFAAQLSGGLTAAHEVGIIHRDLKPQNIMVTDQGEERLKILDFGLAKLLHGDAGADAEDPAAAPPGAVGTEPASGTPPTPGATEDGVFKGTPGYSSPEQIHGDVQGIDHRADQFALGVILYELATGKHPFVQSTDMRSILTATLEVRPASANTINSEIHPGLAQVIDRLLAKKPEDRYASTADLDRAIRQLSRRIRLIPTKRLRFRLKIAVAALVVVGIVFAIVQLTREAVQKAEMVAKIEQHLMDHEIDEALLVRVSYREQFPGDDIKRAVLDDLTISVDELMKARLDDVRNAIEVGKSPRVVLGKMVSINERYEPDSDHPALIEARSLDDKQNLAKERVRESLDTIRDLDLVGVDRHEAVWNQIRGLRRIYCPVHETAAECRNEGVYFEGKEEAKRHVKTLALAVCAEPLTSVSVCERVYDLLGEIEDYESAVSTCRTSIRGELLERLRTQVFRKAKPRDIRELIDRIRSVAEDAELLETVEAYHDTCDLREQIHELYCQTNPDPGEFDTLVENWRARSSEADAGDDEALQALRNAARFLEGCISPSRGLEDDIERYEKLRGQLETLPDDLRNCAQEHLEGLHERIRTQQADKAEKALEVSRRVRDLAGAKKALEKFRESASPARESSVTTWEGVVAQLDDMLAAREKFHQLRLRYLHELESKDFTTAARTFGKAKDQAEGLIRLLDAESAPASAARLLDRAEVAIWRQDLGDAISFAADALAQAPGSAEKQRALLISATARLAASQPDAAAAQLATTELAQVTDPSFEEDVAYLKGVAGHWLAQVDPERFREHGNSALKELESSHCGDGHERAATLLVELRPGDRDAAIVRLDAVFTARLTASMAVVAFGGYDSSGQVSTHERFLRRVRLRRAGLLLKGKQVSRAAEDVAWVLEKNGRDVDAWQILSEQRGVLLDQVRAWRDLRPARTTLAFLSRGWGASRTHVDEMLKDRGTDRELLALSARLSLWRGELGPAREKADRLQELMGHESSVGGLIRFASLRGSPDFRQPLTECLEALPTAADYVQTRSAIAAHLLQDPAERELQAEVVRGCVTPAPAADAFLRCADLHYGQGQYADALSAARRALDAPFTLEGLVRYSGGVQQACGGTQMKSFFFRARRVVVDSLYLLNEYEECVKECARLIEMDPAYSRAHYLSGVANERSGNCEGAIRDLDEAIRLGLSPHQKELALELILRCQRRPRRR